MDESEPEEPSGSDRGMGTLAPLPELAVVDSEVAPPLVARPPGRRVAAAIVVAVLTVAVVAVALRQPPGTPEDITTGATGTTAPVDDERAMELARGIDDRLREAGTFRVEESSRLVGEPDEGSQGCPDWFGSSSGKYQAALEVDLGRQLVGTDFQRDGRIDMIAKGDSRFFAKHALPADARATKAWAREDPRPSPSELDPTGARWYPAPLHMSYPAIFEQVEALFWRDGSSSFNDSLGIFGTFPDLGDPATVGSLAAEYGEPVPSADELATLQGLMTVFGGHAQPDRATFLGTGRLDGAVATHLRLDVDRVAQVKAEREAYRRLAELPIDPTTTLWPEPPTTTTTTPAPEGGPFSTWDVWLDDEGRPLQITQSWEGSVDDDQGPMTGQYIAKAWRFSGFGDDLGLDEPAPGDVQPFGSLSAAILVSTFTSCGGPVSTPRAGATLPPGVEGLPPDAFTFDVEAQFRREDECRKDRAVRERAEAASLTVDEYLDKRNAEWLASPPTDMAERLAQITNDECSQLMFPDCTGEPGDMSPACVPPLPELGPP